MQQRVRSVNFVSKWKTERVWKIVAKKDATAHLSDFSDTEATTALFLPYRKNYTSDIFAKLKSSLKDSVNKVTTMSIREWSILQINLWIDF